MNTLFRSILLSFLLIGATVLQAQTSLSKANKQYELHAFNLAAKSYQSIVERQPNNTEALARLGDCYWHLNRMDEARVFYERAINTGKADLQTHFQYGQTLKAIAQYELAKTYFQKYAETYPLEGKHFAESCDFALSRQQSMADFEVQPEMINTTAADFGPTFFFENVVFSSARIDMKRPNGGQSDWTGSANNQLFIASKDQNGALTRPEFLRSEIRNVFNEGPVSFSADGKWVVITKNNFVDGTRQIPSSGIELSLYLAEVTDKGDWTNPLPFPHNGPGFSTGFGCFSPDGQSLYFASNRPDGFGGFDLFVSNRVGNSWSAPENLGPGVNTAGDEITPFFDGNYLYFASNWHKGFGGFDVFKSQRTRNNWGAVTNMGSGINSPRDDYGYVYNETSNAGYLVSNRVGGKGQEDIYRVQASSDNIVFRVVNATDRKPVPNAQIDLTACGYGRFMTDNNGIYTFRATTGLNCNIEVAKEGYLNATLSLTSMGPQQTREFEVPLKKFGEEYFGGILNVMTGNPVEGALVRAISQTDGSAVEAFSDATGMYGLALVPNTTYVIRYSAPGFVDVNRNLRTTDGQDKGVLGTISITPTTAIRDVDAYRGVNAPAVSDVPTPASAPSSIGEGFAVQVAAVELGRSFDLVEYRNKLASVGNVYIHEEGGFQKVRVGPFESESEAKKMLPKVKAKGYKTAFLVRQPGAAASSDLTPKSGIPQSYNAASAIPAFGATDAEKVKIQLAAYSDMGNFEEQKVSDIGLVERLSKGKLTVILLSGYADKAQAEQALKTAKDRGFIGAYLVRETPSGEYVRVR